MHKKIENSGKINQHDKQKYLMKKMLTWNIFCVLGSKNKEC